MIFCILFNLLFVESSFVPVSLLLPVKEVRYGAAAGKMTCVEYAGRLADRPIDYYNNVLLHSAVGYVTSRDMLEGHAPAIQEERKRKFKAAREKRRFANREMKTNSTMRRETEEGYAGGQPSRNGDATERR